MTDEARIETHPFVLRLKKFSPNINLATVSTLFDAVGDDLHVRPRRNIFVQGYEAHDFYLVERGFAIAYQLLHDGRRQIFAIVVPGDIIGPSAAGLQVARSSVSSLSEMRVQRLRIDVFLEDRDTGGILVGRAELGALSPVPEDPELAGSGWTAMVMLTGKMTGPHTMFLYALSGVTGEEMVVTIPVEVVP